MSLLLACLELAPIAQAAGPDTDGSISGSNNGEGVGVLISRTTGIWNTGTGFEALNHLTGGNQNTATGVRALFNDTNGGFNTATGVYSLYTNTTGFFNSATGAYALTNNTIGSYNTANGYAALYFNSEGEQNTATGFAALYRNTTGLYNTANGYQALYSNTNGFYNTANGWGALNRNTSGGSNTANGYNALYDNTYGHDNTAIGAFALASNTAFGGSNTAVGVSALQSNTTGSNNTAIGYHALDVNDGGSNTAIGTYALYTNTTGFQNIALGFEAGSNVTTADHVIAIGTPGANVSNSCFIGRIFGQTSSGGTAVFINSDGKLGTTTSSRRFKEEIKPMERASEALFALTPVIFRYKKGIDPQGIPQFGLVAEDVEKVDPDLVIRDAEGKVNTVRYEAVNAMLLNEFLKEHRKVEEQQVTIIQLKKEMETLAARLKEQDSKIQKVSAQLEVGKSLPQTVLNNR